MKDVQNQLWVGKFVTQHWNDPQISNNSYDIFKQWKNIPDIVMSINTSIRQQLLNTKIYRNYTNMKKNCPVDSVLRDRRLYL